MLNDKEKEELSGIEEEMKLEYLCTKWTQKESIFKSLNQTAFIPSKIDISSYKTYTKQLFVNGKNYALSVSTDTPERVRFCENIEYLK